jgi:hypothetical protein
MATEGRLKAFDFKKWIEEHEHLLKPPVGNKKVFDDGQMTVPLQTGATLVIEPGQLAGHASIWWREPPPRSQWRSGVKPPCAPRRLL